MVGMAELVDIELERSVEARAYAHLVEIGQMLVDLFDIVLFWEGVADALFEFAVVGIVVEQHGVCLLPVASGAACFLEIGLEAVGAVDVDHQPHVRLVDTHTEGVGGYHHPHLVLLPVALSFVLDGVVESGVVEGGADACLVDEFGDLLGASAAAGIDNGTALDAVEDMDELFALVSGTTHDVSQVPPLE